MDEPDARPGLPSTPDPKDEKQKVHPSSQDLEQFLLGETERETNRRIVRHLLTGCASCGAVFAPFLRQADDPLIDPEELDGRAD
jgi:hypothetical protein